MTTWGDNRDLPKWPDLNYLRVEKRAAGLNTFAGSSFFYPKHFLVENGAPESIYFLTPNTQYNRLNFRHYIAAADSKALSSLDAANISKVARRGFPLARWRVGVTVLLEKIADVTFVSKLRAICLFEVKLLDHASSSRREWNSGQSIYKEKQPL